MQATSSSILQINDFEKAAQYFQPSSKTKAALLLVDFDETMIRSGHADTGHLGGYKWRMTLIRTLGILVERKEIGADHCLLGILTLFVIKAVQVAIAQPEVSTTLTQLQSSGVRVMVFTARGRHGENAWNGLNIKGIDELTEHQMHRAGIHLEQTLLPPHDRIHNHSMIFCSARPKDEILKNLIEKGVFCKTEIGLLGFVDDSPEAVQKVESCAKNQGIPFVGFHYTAIRETEEKEFDLLKATIQLVNLATRGRLLTPVEFETEKRKFYAQQNLTTDDYFQEVVKRINSLFVDHQLYKPFENTDQLYTRVSEVFTRHASRLHIGFS